MEKGFFHIFPRTQTPRLVLPTQEAFGSRATGQTEPERKHLGPGSWVSGAAAAGGQAGGGGGAGKLLAALLVSRALGMEMWPRLVGQHGQGPACAQALLLNFKCGGARWGGKMVGRSLQDSGDPGTQSCPERSGSTGWVWAKRGRFEGLVQDWPVERPHPFPSSGLERKVYPLIPASLPSPPPSLPPRLEFHHWKSKGLGLWEGGERGQEDPGRSGVASAPRGAGRAFLASVCRPRNGYCLAP